MIGNRIRYYRQKFNITQIELAKELNVSKQYISSLENKNINVSVGMAIKIVNSITNIISKKSHGLQKIKISVEDVFYLLDE